MKIALPVLCLLLALPARAEDFRHWIVRVGAHPIQPQTENHPEFRLDDATVLSLGATYLFSENWGIELFATAPAQHSLHRVAGESVGSFDVMPVAASLQYHVVDRAEHVRAYAGVGVVYATLGDEHTFGSLEGQRMQVDSGAGITAHVGLDLNLGPKWFASIDARWFDIDTPLVIASTGVGQLGIDPFAFGLSLGRRLR